MMGTPRSLIDELEALEEEEELRRKRALAAANEGGETPSEEDIIPVITQNENGEVELKFKTSEGTDKERKRAELAASIMATALSRRPPEPERKRQTPLEATDELRDAVGVYRHTGNPGAPKVIDIQYPGDPGYAPDITPVGDNAMERYESALSQAMSFSSHGRERNADLLNALGSAAATYTPYYSADKKLDEAKLSDKTRRREGLTFEQRIELLDKELAGQKDIASAAQRAQEREALTAEYGKLIKEFSDYTSGQKLLEGRDFSAIQHIQDQMEILAKKLGQPAPRRMTKEKWEELQLRAKVKDLKDQGLDEDDIKERLGRQTLRHPAPAPVD